MSLKLLLVALGLALFAQAPQPPRSNPLTIEMLRRAAQAGGGEPIEVLIAEKQWAGADVLLPLATDGYLMQRIAAVRALGRLEDPALVPLLLALKDIPPSAVADAVAQSLNHFDPASNPELIATVATWTQRQARAIGMSSAQGLALAASMMSPMSRIPYTTADQVHDVEDILRRVAESSAHDPQLIAIHEGAIRGFESLARHNIKVTPFQEDSIRRLDLSFRGSASNDRPDAVRWSAFAALLQAHALDPDMETTALNDDYWQTRQLAMTMLAGAGAGLDDAARHDLILAGLKDRSAHVRYDAVTAYARREGATNGCGPLVAAASDADPQVAVHAIDALGSSCKSDEQITEWLTENVRVPPAVGPWQQDTTAFVALAKRSPQRAAISMEAFVTHPVWWVRMHAAAAAAAANDTVRLDKLAYDPIENVREATLGPLRRQLGADAERPIVAALRGSDPQLLRTAALLLKEFPSTPRFFRPLLDAFAAITKEGKETSRDARLALLDAIARHATRDDHTELVPFLKDFDSKIAAKVSDVIAGLTGKNEPPQPMRIVRGWTDALGELRQCVNVSMASGGAFRIVMNPRVATVTVVDFLHLVANHYYDGTTFHRVVPNFVVQGGSPGANEYSGSKQFMRDEIGGSNVRGAVGLSTRGRNTGDAQFYINLVNNPRLDDDYTVFAQISPKDMDEVVDRIQEGDRMSGLTAVRCGR